MVNGRDMASNNNCVYPLLTQVDWCHALETGTVISKEAMHSEKADHAVVTQHFQNITPALVVVPVSGRELFEAFFFSL